VAVPYGNCTEPSTVEAGGQACPVRFHRSGCGFYRPDPSYIPAIEDHLRALKANRETAQAIDAARFVIDNLSAEIDQFGIVRTAMRTPLQALEPADLAVPTRFGPGWTVRSGPQGKLPVARDLLAAFEALAGFQCMPIGIGIRFPILDTVLRRDFRSWRWLWPKSVTRSVVGRFGLVVGCLGWRCGVPVGESLVMKMFDGGGGVNDSDDWLILGLAAVGD
jgi:hypothetical protein